MAPTTRRSLRNQTPATSTASTNPSPLFSANVSVTGSPSTTDGEQETKKSSTRSQAPRGKKRAATSDDDEEEEQKRAPKRRVTAKRVYVELPASKNKGKMFAPNAKGKAKAKAVPVPAISDDEDIQSDAALEYDENRSLVDSGSSGSEFVASEDEESFHDDSSEDERPAPAKKRAAVVVEPIYESGSDEDEDTIMLDAAMHLSLQTSRNTNGAGPSSGAAITTEAARRAAIIENRLAARARCP